MTSKRKEALIADAQRRNGELMRARLDALGEQSLTVDVIEGLVEEVGREIGAWLEARLIAEQAPSAANCAACPRCGTGARYKQRYQYYRSAPPPGVKSLWLGWRYLAGLAQGWRLANQQIYDA